MGRLAYAFEIAFQIVIIIGGAIALGLFLDNWLNTLPLFVIVLSLLGVGSAFWRIIQLTK